MTATSDRFVTAPRDPSGALVTAVGYDTVAEAPRDHRGLPSPFLTFIVTLDSPVVIAEGGGERGLDVVVAGLSTKAEMVKMPEPRLRERLAEAGSWDQRFAIFASEMELGRADAPPPGTLGRPRPEVVEAWSILTASRGRIRIGELAERVFLSRRRLSTLFVAELGITPKEAARTMRFTHAVSRIGQGVRGRALDLARVAAECGYADQSHLDREFRAFAGTSPTGWIAEEFPNIQAGGHRYARDWEA